MNALKFILYCSFCWSLWGASDEKVELQKGASSNYDFSFLPEVVSEYNSEQISLERLLIMLKPVLARQTTILLSQNDLKKLVVDRLESYYQRKAYLELATFAGYLPNEGIAGLYLDSLKQSLGEDVLRAQFEFTGLSFKDAARYYAEETAMKDYFNKIILPNVQINEADALAYYFDNEEEFKVEESVKISQIFFGFLDEESKERARLQAKKAMQLLNSGKLFSEVAPLYNFGGILANSGEIDRFFSRKHLRKELHVAFAMKKDSISAILESAQGFHIIKLREKRAAGQLAFDEVKSSLIKQMMQQGAKRLLNEKIIARLKAGDFKLHLKE